MAGILNKLRHYLSEKSELRCKLDSARSEGRLAYCNGIDRTNNPYTLTDKDLAIEWARGWDKVKKYRKHLEANPPENNLITPSNKHSSSVAKDSERIVSSYGSYIEHNPIFNEIRDVAVLPYSKEEILDALLFEIKNEKNEKRLEALEMCTVMLASFQNNVGLQPLNELGVGLKELSNMGKRYKSSQDIDAMKELVDRITDSPNKEQYYKFKSFVDNEEEELLKRIKSAEAGRK